MQSLNSRRFTLKALTAAVALTTLSRTDERLRELIGATQRDVPKPVEPAVLMSEIARLTGRERRRERR